MKETPLLFQGPMIRAILELRKTQTRRMYRLKEINKEPDAWKLMQFKHGIAIFLHLTEMREFWIKCPYWDADQFWVRETFCYENKEYVERYKKEPWRGTPDPFNAETRYKATESAPETLSWRPCIFMPRWASRIQLQKTADVRLERLQDIGDVMKCDVFKECAAEGYPHAGHIKNRHYIEWFFQLWNSINAKAGYGWEKNPWVWVPEFKLFSVEGVMTAHA